MTLQEAIEISNDLLGDPPTSLPDDRRGAVKLGLEALELIKLNRELWGNLEAFQLPGETKE